MATPTQGGPGYYVWEGPGKSVTVHLSLGVVDGLLAEGMRGLASVPERGAEIGGILLGSVQPGNPAVVRVEAYKVFPCSYKHGLSYLLADDEDASGFENVHARHQPDGSSAPFVVGYFRSNTRDQLTLAPEDLQLLDRYFPDPADVALLIKPFISRASIGALFVREDGVFPTTAVEFPFRRWELMGEEPLRHALAASEQRARDLTALGSSVSRNLADVNLPDTSLSGDARESEKPPGAFVGPASIPGRLDPRDSDMGHASRWASWMWLPLSFILLLLGVLLGFQAAVTMGTRNAASPADNFALALSVTKSNDNLNVKWNPAATAVRLARRGTLEIEDGTYRKSVDLDVPQLLNGNIIYRNTSKSVRFRLVVYPAARATVTETLEWRQ